jgi:hypothetical protein
MFHVSVNQVLSTCLFYTLAADLITAAWLTDRTRSEQQDVEVNSCHTVRSSGTNPACP